MILTAGYDPAVDGFPPGTVRLNVRTCLFEWEYEEPTFRANIEDLTRESAARMASEAGLAWLDSPVGRWKHTAPWWEYHLMGYGFPAPVAVN